MLLRHLAASKENPRPKLKSNNKQGLFKEQEDKQHLTISSTFKVKMRKMMK